MRDPGLVAVNLIVSPWRTARVFSEARSEPVLGSVNTAVGSTSPERSSAAICVLILGAGAQNKFGGDLGSGAKRADADIAARQFLGDHADRFLAKPHAAEIFGDGQAEDAELRHLSDDVERNIGVFQMPCGA